MKALVQFLTVGLLATTGAASAQTCPVLGNTAQCPPAPTQKALAGTQPQVGGTTQLNYATGLAAQRPDRAQPGQHGQTAQKKWLLPQSSPHPATQRQGAPQSSPQLGNGGYDTGSTTRSNANAGSYGNSVTSQSLGKTGHDSTGKGCQQVGAMTNCN